MPRLEHFQICIGVFSFEVIPGEETIQGIEVVPLRHKTPFPCFLDLLEWEDAKKLFYLIKIEIAHSKRYELLIANTIKTYRFLIIRPKSILLLQLLKELTFYLFNLIFILDYHKAKVCDFPLAPTIQSQK